MFSGLRLMRSLYIVFVDRSNTYVSAEAYGGMSVDFT